MRVVAGADQFVARLDGVLAADLGEVVLQREVFADVLEARQSRSSPYPILKKGKVSPETFGIPSCLAQSSFRVNAVSSRTRRL